MIVQKYLCVLHLNNEVMVLDDMVKYRCRVIIIASINGKIQCGENGKYNMVNMIIWPHFVI